MWILLIFFYIHSQPGNKESLVFCQHVIFSDVTQSVRFTQCCVGLHCDLTGAGTIILWAQHLLKCCIDLVSLTQTQEDFSLFFQYLPLFWRYFKNPKLIVSKFNSMWTHQIPPHSSLCILHGFVTSQCFLLFSWMTWVIIPMESLHLPELSLKLMLSFLWTQFLGNHIACMYFRATFESNRCGLVSLIQAHSSVRNATVSPLPLDIHNKQ